MNNHTKCKDVILLPMNSSSQSSIGTKGRSVVNETGTAVVVNKDVRLREMVSKSKKNA